MNASEAQSPLNDLFRELLDPDVPPERRHIMSQTACELRRFPVPLRWLHAGGDLSRRNHANQRADRPSIRSTPSSRSLLRASRPHSPPYPGRLAPASRPPS